MVGTVPACGYGGPGGGGVLVVVGGEFGGSLEGEIRSACLETQCLIHTDSTKSKQGQIRLNQQYCVFVDEQMVEEEPGTGVPAGAPTEASTETHQRARASVKRLLG